MLPSMLRWQNLMRRVMRRQNKEKFDDIRVVNLLPEFVADKWVFTQQTLVNANYSVSNYSGESTKPEGNIMVVYPSGNYVECYTSPIESLWPPLTVGHTYYLRWLSRKEWTETGNGSTSGITEDVYWPEVEDAILRGLNSSHYTRFRNNSHIFTLQQSQWPNLEVQDGRQKIRFDCNNQRKYVRYFVLADFMLIDLTKTYTDNGLVIPTLTDLTSKPYFFGSKRLHDWHR